MIDLSRLTIDEKLGSGGQGRVFLATDPDGKRFAVKVVGTQAGQDPSPRLAALRADDLVGPLVPVLAQVKLADLPANLRRHLGSLPREGRLLVMPFVSGAPLSKIRLLAPLSSLEAAMTLASIAAKLVRLPKGVAHGDLRAPNVLVQPDGDVALIDPDLWREPAPDEDVHALAELGRELCGGEVHGALVTLLDDLGNRARPLTPTEAAAQLAGAAQALGALPGNFGVALAQRVEKAGWLLDATTLESKGRAPEKRHSKRILWWVAAVPVALLCLMSGLTWAVEHITTETAVSQNDVVTTPSPGTAPFIQANPGVVSYPEQLHMLTSGQMAAAEDGLVVARVLDSVPRVAILSARGDVLWERARPEPGQEVYFDVKPGVYVVEIDRENQVDKEPARVDVSHPFRLLVTARAYHAPTRESHALRNIWRTFKMLLGIR